MDLFPIYILLDTTGGDTRVMEAANKWIWELNSPISPGSNAKIISLNIEWNYRIKDVLYFAHRVNPETDNLEFVDIVDNPDWAARKSGNGGYYVTLHAKRYGHIVLYLQDKK
ncbi:MAG TPA: hypothetical protein DCE41_07825 [Cytophagales bacterium]|nr:hypothetical protein [Cytophagales bacterium]HAA19807.1 hypothetical protein [Cytophagales bacterium]HAP64235.1 hypothetical protein [Cytophagales bacterium]